MRRLIAGALTPKAIESLEDGLVHLVNGLLDRMEERQRAGGEVDLIEDFAAAIPVEIIGNLLGVPRDEREPLRNWSLAILGALEPRLTEAQMEAGNSAVTEMVAYLRTLVAERRRHPGDPAHDVLTRLIQGEEAPSTGSGQDKLSENELYQNCIFILNAGHETTTNLIGNGLVALLEWPEEKHRLLDDPRSSEARSKNSCASRAPTSWAIASRPSPPRSAASRCRPARRSRSPSARRTAIRRCSMRPIGSTSRARRTGIWPSARARTSAWA